MDGRPGPLPAGGDADEVAFATKPELAHQMIERAIGASVPFGWVAADEAYEQNTALSQWLDQHRVRYVLAVPKSFTATTAAGPRRTHAKGATALATGH